MNTYPELRQKALDSVQNWLSYDILESNQELVYHPPVNPHGTEAMFTVFEDESAVCCTEKEALILHELTKRIKPSLFIEIGAYAGWSSAHILKALKYPSIFIAVDNFSECKNPQLIKSLLYQELKRYDYALKVEQDSTEFLNNFKEKADVIFIDGFHRDGKPLADIKAAVKVLKPDGYIILHDTWMPNVDKACDYLIQQGYKSWMFTTDNQLEIYTKGDLSWIKEIVV